MVSLDSQGAWWTNALRSIPSGDILIAGGELGRTLYEFAAFLHNKTYDIVQPDTRICGGIWAARKIAALAASFGVPCIQHGNSQGSKLMSPCVNQRIVDDGRGCKQFDHDGSPYARACTMTHMIMQVSFDRLLHA